LIKKRTKLGRYDGARYYAVVDDITDSDPNNPYSRSYILLDGVLADRFDREGPQAMAAPDGLALIRAISTPYNWGKVTSGPPIAKGDWVALSLDDGGAAPLAWEMLAVQNYAQGPARSLREIRRLGDGTTGAQANEMFAMKLSFASAGVKPQRPTQSAQSIVEILAKAIPTGAELEILAIDVGQASANLVKANHLPIVVFDAGAPIWFNKNSLPRRFSPPILGKAPVVLSHWDFDHFDLGRRYVYYQNRPWYAPDQPVGPNTALFQRTLGSNLSFFSGLGQSGAFTLAPGLGSNPKDRNGTGYQLRVTVGSEVALLTGDAPYSAIRASMLSKVTSLTIPHHAGRDMSPPPSASGLRRAVASYGVPNSYRHPDPGTISAHRSAGWQVDQTATTTTKLRGNRRLLP